MKTLSLFVHDLKRFLRDWKSIVLLTVFPLAIVVAIFLSFSPTSTTVPVGAVQDTQGFNYSSFQSKAPRVANLRTYDSLDDCLDELREYRVYACVLIDDSDGPGKYSLTAYYDNTREIIDQTVLSGIRRAVRNMQITYSERQASAAISEVQNQTDRIGAARNEVDSTVADIETQILDINSSIAELRSTRTEIRLGLRDLDQDVEDVEDSAEKFEQSRTTIYSDSSSRITRMRSSLAAVQQSTSQNLTQVWTAQRELSALESDLDEYNQAAAQEVDDVQSLVSDYDEFRNDSTEYLEQINSTIDELQTTRSRLRNYTDRLKAVETDLEDTQERYSAVSSRDPEGIARAVRFERKRAFQTNPESPSLVVLQSIYSTLLLMVSLFVSILISMFVSLNDINTPAGPRLESTPGTAIPRYLSSLMTSLTLTVIPILCVLAIGEFFLELPISDNFAPAALALLMFSVVLTNLGLALAQLIRNKSTTLLVGSFVIVFLIFFSGLVLPIEMMSTIPRTIASLLPGNVTMKAFDQAVLHGQRLEEGSVHYIILSLWSVLSLGVSAHTRPDVRRRISEILH
jgi:ABC-type multidrug transport system, permease component|nr:MAG: ABC-type multidrug transport system, permease component [Candidatus Nanosalinarum sp. J07AB56]